VLLAPSRENLLMSSVLIQLTGGAGLLRRADGAVFISHDVGECRGQPLHGRDDYRPVQTWLDEARSVVAGLLPPGAVAAQVIDGRGTRVTATTGDGVYGAIIEQPNDGRGPIVCCRDQSGAPVPRPLPADWTRIAVTDAEEPCPACGAIDYDEVLPTDGSRGGQGGHGHDGPLRPCRIVVCRRCGHEEGAGSGLIRFRAPDDEDAGAKAARVARHRAEARVRNWHADRVTLRGVSFPIYAAESWPARINGSGSSGGNLTKITIGHHREETDDPFRRPHLTVTTATDEHRNSMLHHAQHALEMWVHDDHNPPRTDGLSDAATKLWFAARRRERYAASLAATQAEKLIAIDGTPQPFLTLSAAGGRWVAVRRHEDLTITVAGRAVDLGTIRLEPVSDPAARLLGPEPEEPAG
jgi:hypothetical protein